MHLLIITQQWAPEYGIPQLRGAWMVRELTQAGHTVSVVTAPPHYPTGRLLDTSPEYQPGAVAEGPSGELIYRSHFREHTPSIPSRIADQAVICTSSVRQALLAIKHRKPDLILASCPPLPAAFTAHTVSSMKRIPYVVDIRDSWPDLARYVGISDYILLGRTAPTRRGQLRTPAILAGAELFGKALKDAAGLITTSSIHSGEVALRYHKPTQTLSNIILEDAAALAANHRASHPSISNLQAGSHETKDAEAPDSIHSANEVDAIAITGSQEKPRAQTTPNAQTAATASPLGRRLRVLYAGTVGRAQGIDNVIRAANEASTLGYPIDLKIVGNGTHLKVAKALAQNLGVSVDFPGRVAPEIVRAHYDWADVALVVLQDWAPLRLTVPSKTFQVIASGKYVVGALEGAAAEIITKLGAGSVVPPMQPEALAAEFARLAMHPEDLSKNAHGAERIAAEQVRLNSGYEFTRFIEMLAARR
ncbi:MAG: glycosyltransferase family 4 protein [Actinomycetaceae bacterium]|nr:glycosyltransferase family 4 protein [Arcanobacterium sp.]MDD7504602.1 glycosyltransferase family 4 protein [Actinomycetaceae bacterium]MDY6143082.1 glycosyltransferase family 4 protein [Arcanobacterium sp.]